MGRLLMARSLPEHCADIPEDCRTGECADDKAALAASGFGPDCESVFDRVAVSHLARGCTQVFWELREDFSDPPPYEFQLQFSDVRNAKDTEWLDVGDPVTDALTAEDPERRAYGKINRTHYRVKVTTSAGEHFSDPVGMEGTLSPQDWRSAREILRLETLEMRKGHSGQEGFLLKRRITGINCPSCLDYVTREILNPDCQHCWGTGKKFGYYYPVCDVWADIDPKTYRTHLDSGQARGTVQDIVVRARMINTWLLGEEDIWVNKKTDDRYAVHTVQNLVEIRGVPLVASVELRPFPFTDVAYQIPIPGQN